MAYEGWVSTGTPWGETEGVPYLKLADTFDRFVWGGRCMRVTESTEALGDVTVTTRQNPRGGLERDQARLGQPGETTYSLEIKKLQADRKRSDLKVCFWHVDQRMHCGGIDRDSPFQWEEIKRHCYSKFTNRRDSGTNWEGDNPEALVAFDSTALYTDDIWRVTLEEYLKVQTP